MKFLSVLLLALPVACAPAAPAPPRSPIERGPLCGAVTTNSAVIKAKLATNGATARLVFSRSAELTEPLYSAADTAATNRGKVVAFTLDQLVPDTAYHYALEIDGKIVPEKHGEFRTFPMGPVSFSFAFGSCSLTGSTNKVFDVIRENRPLFYMNDGDWHYEDIRDNVRSRFRAAYDKVLASPPQAKLYRHIPFVYMWDDHDFTGDNSDTSTKAHEATRLTYQEYIPHYPLAAGQGDVPIYQTFTVGRAKFILTDLRSARDKSNKKDDDKKSMLGAAQKEWFKQQLLEANGKYPLIVWVTTVPWLGHSGSNYYRSPTNFIGYMHHTNLPARPSAKPAIPRAPDQPRPPASSPPAGEDHWASFSTERRELADFIKTNHIQGVCILHGDSHMLAADDGSNGDYATDGGGAKIPVMCAGPLDNAPSIKGGPYSQGVYKVKKNEGCFGLVNVTDTGGEITVQYSGRNNLNLEKVSLKFTVPAP